MAFCNNCGRELKDGVKFCEECGAPTIVQAQQSGKTNSTNQRSSIWFYSVPVFISGLAVLMFGLFGWFVFYRDAVDNKVIILPGEKLTAQDAAHEAYEMAAWDMQNLIILGIVFIVIAIIIWLITKFVKLPKNDVIRVLLWIIPLVAVLIVTGILYEPCLAYVIEYGFGR